MITVYTYAKCSTCRDAVKWLKSHGVAFEEKAIRDTPPAISELRAMLVHQAGNLLKLFNTSGQDYRAQGLKDKLPSMPEAAALSMLKSNGNLVKRPFLIGSGKLPSDHFGLVGFDPKVWGKALSARFTSI